MSSTEHKLHAPNSIRCKVITVSDTRTLETDKSGHLIVQLLEAEGHQIAVHTVIKYEIDMITEEILKGCRSNQIDEVITNGGTGVAKRDVTIEAVQPLIEKELPGFGEIFRLLSYRDAIGSAAILSRAIAGIVKDTVVFSLPGSTGAVKLGMNKLILPEISHIVSELRKDI